MNANAALGTADVGTPLPVKSWPDGNSQARGNRQRRLDFLLAAGTLSGIFTLSILEWFDLVRKGVQDVNASGTRVVLTDSGGGNCSSDMSMPDHDVGLSPQIDMQAKQRVVWKPVNRFRATKLDPHSFGVRVFCLVRAGDQAGHVVASGC
nr:hypothetical protein [Gemmata massiliana]